MPFLYPSKVAITVIKAAFPFLSQEEATEVILAYAHAVYADRSQSLTEIDVLQIKWIIGTYFATAHILASEAVGSVLDKALS